MGSDLQEPLVPAEVDLRDFQFMPLDVAVLCDSGIAVEASGDEFRAAVLLWCKSWHQVPAGSLPDNDAMLSQYAGYGRVVGEWQKVRAGALRGFVKCADGRLYHPVIAEKVMDAWDHKVKQRERSAKGNAKRWGKHPKGTPPTIPEGLPEGSPEESGSDPKGQGQGQGQGQGTNNSLSDPVVVTAAGAANNTDDLISAFDAALVSVWGEGARRACQHNTDAATAEQWAASGITATLAGRVLRERFEKMRARKAKPPFSLAAFGDELRRALAADQPQAEPAAARSEDDDRSRWRLRLTGHGRGLPWSSSWGDPPGEPGCQAPRDLIAEILPHLVPSADVIPLKRAVQ